MKNLYHHVVEVSNDLERKMAIAFYRRASKKPLHPCHRTGRYVGLTERGFVCSNFIKYPYEVVVPFKDMNTLADTPSRKAALNNAVNKYAPAARKQWVVAGKVENKTKPEAKKTPSKLLPVAVFTYPKRNCAWAFNDRKVRVVKLNDIDLIGFDINDGEKFKRFKVSKIRGSVRLAAFNS